MTSQKRLFLQRPHCVSEIFFDAKSAPILDLQGVREPGLFSYTSHRWQNDAGLEKFAWLLPASV